MTQKDIAKRVVYQAGMYLYRQYQDTELLWQLQGIHEAIVILAETYNALLGSPSCSKAETDSTLTTA